jgi:L-threonine kinase
MSEGKTYSAVAAMPATCGELVQGSLDGTRCLVSCPIDRYSTCRIALKRGAGWDAPCDIPKTLAAVQAALRERRCPGWGGRLRFDARVPRGRGYGSSTADIGAALGALGQALGKPFSAEHVAKLAVSVEPTDSTIFPGLALFAHRDAAFHLGLGPAPPLAILVLDPGGQIDTLAFNRLDHGDALRRLSSQHRVAFGLLQEGVTQGDWETVGEAATLSAIAHQSILHSALLGPALRLAQDIGALGLCRAHSGTLVGLLLDPARVDVRSCTTYVAEHLPTNVTASVQSLVDGGPRVDRKRIVPESPPGKP